MHCSTRRSFVKSALAIGALSAVRPLANAVVTEKQSFRISLAQWSLHRRFLSRDGAEPLDHLEFARVARSLGIDAVEYVNLMFMDRAQDDSYLGEMKRRAADEGVQSLLIMCDGEGMVGASSDTERTKTIHNHLKWLDAAAFLGCHSIRVSAHSDITLGGDEQAKLAADGLHRLGDQADRRGLNVLAENHGGLSSNAKWLTRVMSLVDHHRVGILPDFGNFYTNRETSEMYNPYQGMREFMPWVKGAVSAKAYDWDTGAGRFYTEDRRERIEMTLDYKRLISIVTDFGYTGYIGIEYEGRKLPEYDGIRRTKEVLEELRAALA